MTDLLRLNSITATISIPDEDQVKPFQAQSGILTISQKWGNSKATNGDFQKTVDIRASSYLEIPRSFAILATRWLP